jgi:methylphosphotriester-DNA--protein-cysteine methyltransferase
MCDCVSGLTSARDTARSASCRPCLACPPMLAGDKTNDEVDLLQRIKIMVVTSDTRMLIIF